MRRIFWLGTLLALLGYAVTAQQAATSASATMGVSITVSGSVSFVLQSDASGFGLTNSGTPTVTATLGTMSAYGGTVPAGITRTINGLTWKIGTPFDVVVLVSNLVTANYTLTAQLQNLDLLNIWDINSIVLTSVVPSVLTVTGVYGSTPMTFHLTIPFSEIAGPVSNTISFVATCN